MPAPEPRAQQAAASELWPVQHTLDYAEQFCQRWLHEEPRALLALGGDDAAFSVAQVDDAVERELADYAKMLYFLAYHELESRADTGSLQRALACLYHSRAALRHTAVLEAARRDDAFVDTMPPICGISIESYSPDEDYQEWLKFLMSELLLRGLALCRDYVFEQHYYGGHCTYYWRELYTIQEFVNRATDSETHHRFWCTMVAGQNLRNAVWFLEQTTERAVRRLEKNRGVFSFRNGVYFMRTNRFHAYADGALAPPPIASRFFDSDFQPNWCSDPLAALRLPAHERVFEGQQWGADVREWFRIMAGRWYYPVGELDDWQVVMFCKGVANTGKSTILTNMSRSYDEHDVGLLSNNIESTFGLSSQYDKFGIIATEIGQGFKLDQKLWQQMVSGEAVTIAVKGKPPVNVPRFQTSMLMAGNHYMDFDDNSGSVSRRLLTFLFHSEIAPADLDPTLKDKLLAELPLFIVRCNRSYLRALEEYAGKSIWSVLPDYFHRTKREVSENTDDLVSFLKNTDDLEFSAEGRMLFSDFQNSFKRFCESNGRPRHNLSDDFIRTGFATYGLRKERLRVNGARRFYVLGCESTAPSPALHASGELAQ